MSLRQKTETTIQAIKKNPMDLNLRLSLIQLYALEGNWQQALKTMQGYLKLNPTDEQSKTLLLSNIECEIKRQQVFNGQEAPVGYPSANQAVIDFQQSLLDDYHKQQSPTVINERFLAFVDGLDFSLNIDVNQTKKPSELKTYQGVWLDTDMRVACILELFLQGSYYWLPLSDIQRIVFKDSEVMTDIIWRRAEIELINGDVTSGFVPARYVMTDSAQLLDDIKYARLTQWQEINGMTIGQGQKVWSNGELDVAMLDIKYVNASSASLI